MIQVMIVDDQPITRAAIRGILESDSTLKVIAEAASGEEAIELASNLNADVILMDIKMPNLNGVQATKKILAHQPEAKIIALTSITNEQSPKEMLQTGARGYLTKNSGQAEIIRAVKTVAAGQIYIETDIASRLAQNNVEDSKKRGKRRHGQAIKTPFDRLAPREMEVIRMTISGNTTQEIGEHYGISTKTVNSNRYRTFEKLGVKNDTELTLMALRYGLIDKHGNIQSPEKEAVKS